ncbi:hypothetical protein GCM10010400_57270 [Streptomyces aculeolatus]
MPDEKEPEVTPKGGHRPQPPEDDALVESSSTKGDDPDKGDDSGGTVKPLGGHRP